MSEGTLNEAILQWMAAHGISKGRECPVLKVSLVGYDLDGSPLFKVRAAYDQELHAAAHGKEK